MRFVRPRKLTLDGRPIYRKRRLHTNAMVSGNYDEFSCEGYARMQGRSRRMADLLQTLIDEADHILKGYDITTEKKSVIYGISKQEEHVSQIFSIDGMRDVIGKD